MLAAGQPLVWRSSLFSCGGVFILCIKLWRYFHLVRSPILTLWGRGQFKSLLLQPSHSRLMRKPTKKEEEGRKEKREKISMFSATFISAATDVCRSTPRPSCTTGSIINRPNVAIVLSGQSAQVVLCSEPRRDRWLTSAMGRRRQAI